MGEPYWPADDLVAPMADGPCTILATEQQSLDWDGTMKRVARMLGDAMDDDWLTAFTAMPGRSSAPKWQRDWARRRRARKKLRTRR